MQVTYGGLKSITHKNPTFLCVNIPNFIIDIIIYIFYIVYPLL